MSINNRRARCAVRVASWILRTFAPDYSRVLNNMWRRDWRATVWLKPGWYRRETHGGAYRFTPITGWRYIPLIEHRISRSTT